VSRNNPVDVRVVDVERDARQLADVIRAVRAHGDGRRYGQDTLFGKIKEQSEPIEG
jgi:hypothetical protein